MKLVVHIGPGKTGSTAIQKSLRNAAAQLAAHDVSFLGLMFEHAPVRKFDWQRPAGFDAFSRLPASRAAEEVEEVIVETIQHADQAGLRTCVLSNESWLRRGEVVREVLDRVRQRGQMDILVVAYARNHFDLVRSAYVQWGLLHKTYKGGIKGFPAWVQERDLALYPKIAEWSAVFGDTFRLRNYDAAQDVVADFLETAGLNVLPVESMRTYGTPSPNEIVLRALFNDLHQEVVSPSRFSKLFNVRNLRYDRVPSEWLRSLLPDDRNLEAISDALAEDRGKINKLLVESGQPELGSGHATDSHDSAPESEALITTLFQMIAMLSLKVEKLEHEQHAIRRVAAPDAGRAQQQADVGLGNWLEGLPHTSIVEELAPALGYFGAHPVDCLEVPVGGRLQGLRISLDEPKPVFLNLRGLELLKAGKPIQVDLLGAIAEQSSIAGDDPGRNGPALLLSSKGIHSKAEHAPWWQAWFARPIECDTLRIWNRSDGWGCRSRTLRLESLSRDGVVELLHDNQAALCLRKVVGDLVDATGGRPLAAWPASAEEARAWRDARLDEVARRLHSGELSLAAAPWRSLMQVMDVWGREGEPSPASWIVIAAFLLHQYLGKRGTSIKAMSLLLNSRERLLHLQEQINRLAVALDMGRFMLTRHGVKSEGVLRREPERFVAHMRAVIAALHSLGREPILAYGTLLGAVRDRDFIAHDDDIDLMYRSSAGSRPEAEQDVIQLKEDLRGRGFRVVDLLPNSLNLHVIDTGNGAVMDVFPCWIEDGRLHMHMESMKVRGIPPEIVYPAGEIEFHGMMMPAPAQPEVFLRERYGEGWNVSDQFYEWPWPLHE